DATPVLRRRREDRGGGGGVERGRVRGDHRVGRSQPLRGRRGARSRDAGCAGAKRFGGAPVDPAPPSLLGRLGNAELGGARWSDEPDEFEDGASRLRAGVSHTGGDGGRLGVRALAVTGSRPVTLGRRPAMVARTSIRRTPAAPANDERSPERS